MSEKGGNAKRVPKPSAQYVHPLTSVVSIAVWVQGKDVRILVRRQAVVPKSEIGPPSDKRAVTDALTTQTSTILAVTVTIDLAHTPDG
jgi:hypothetical protein